MYLHSILPDKKIGFVSVPYQRNDSAACRIEIPVGVVNGQFKGPTFLLTGGTHGDEFIGPLALTKLFKQLEPSTISGKIIIAPTLNPSGSAAATRLTPEDNMNLNQSFPGTMGGNSLTQKMAKAITEELLKKADYLVDVHSGGRSFTYLPGSYLALSDNREINKQSYELARHLGFNKLYLVPPKNKIAHHAMGTAHALNKPAISLEVGGGESVRKSLVDETVKNLKNVLAYKKILNKDFQLIDPTPLYIAAENITWANADGIFVMRDEPGTHVHADTKAGYIISLKDVFVETKDIFYSAEGLLVCWRNSNYCKKGDVLIRVAKDGQFLLDNYVLS